MNLFVIAAANGAIKNACLLLLLVLWFAAANLPAQLMLSAKKKKQSHYRSVISDIFDGTILSLVQCLTCDRVRWTSALITLVSTSRACSPPPRLCLFVNDFLLAVDSTDSILCFKDQRARSEKKFSKFPLGHLGWHFKNPMLFFHHMCIVSRCKANINLTLIGQRSRSQWFTTLIFLAGT